MTDGASYKDDQGDHTDKLKEDILKDPFGDVARRLEPSLLTMEDHEITREDEPQVDIREDGSKRGHEDYARKDREKLFDLDAFEADEFYEDDHTEGSWSITPEGGLTEQELQEKLIQDLVDKRPSLTRDLLSIYDDLHASLSLTAEELAEEPPVDELRTTVVVHTSHTPNTDKRTRVRVRPLPNSNNDDGIIHTTKSPRRVHSTREKQRCRVSLHRRSNEHPSVNENATVIWVTPEPCRRSNEHPSVDEKATAIWTAVLRESDAKKPPVSESIWDAFLRDSIGDSKIET